VRGKLIRRSLKTDQITVAKLRLGDLEKTERQKGQSAHSVVNGKMTFGEPWLFSERELQDSPSINIMRGVSPPF